ncbi:MarR family winged helix-turn-helix transcriptional regulator [Streptomyces sp. NPDC058613]|uniref:MarR family winged helix-turn-helix transcriptional regulator n=1 Tax=unclassified Streptomyces TaxID=2593676 RepID=UPI003668B85D
MRQSPIRPSGPVASAVADVGELIELLEIVWERGRDTVSAPPVSSAQARVLFVIEKNEEINPSALGRLLGAAPPSVTRLCDRLQAIGFLERNPSPADRRELQLRLTPRGRAYLGDLRSRRQEALAEAMAAMPAASREALAVGLSDFLDAVAGPLRLPAAGSAESARSRTA